MLGFEFLKNFDAPYRAESITDLWRRWNISLSSVLRDYLYLPLGGNRLGPMRTYINSRYACIKANSCFSVVFSAREDDKLARK